MPDPLAHHLTQLRHQRRLSLDQAATLSGVSRASLSRIEKAQVSPTADTLGKLCAAYQISMSRLLALVEDQFAAIVSETGRPTWTDPETGFQRQLVSPANGGLQGEVLRCTLPAGQRLSYDRPPRPGLEHHLLLQTGDLTVTVEGAPHTVRPGDCLRYRLQGPTEFTAGPNGADYLLFLV